MIRSKFKSQLDQLLHSISDIEGMITADESRDLRDKVHELLDDGSEAAAAYAPSRDTHLHLHAANALTRFLSFITAHEHEFDDAMNRAVRLVAADITQHYAVTSKREKDLLEAIRRKANALQDHHRRAG